MKWIKRIFIWIFILMTLTFLFRGWMYRSAISYQANEKRVVNDVHVLEFKSHLDSIHRDREIRDIDDVIELGQKVTSEHLSYRIGKCDTDPSILFKSRKTHCVGYANFCAAVINHLIQKDTIALEWVAEPAKSELYLFGKFNIHDHWNDPFFKDHDIVILRNTSTFKEIAIDPTLHDLTGIERIKLK